MIKRETLKKNEICKLELEKVTATGLPSGKDRVLFNVRYDEIYLPLRKRDLKTAEAVYHLLGGDLNEEDNL